MLTTKTELSPVLKPALLTSPSQPRSPSRVLLTLLVLPVLAYAVTMLLSVLQRGNLQFGEPDLMLLILVLAYCCVGIYLAALRHALHLTRFLAGLYAILFAGVVAETALRLLLPPCLQNVPWLPMHCVFDVGTNLPGITGTVEYTVNNLGVRGPAVRLEEVDLRILCVGGSTTECLYVTDKLSWPWLLQDKLSRQLGKKVFVGNAGHAGHIVLNHDFLLTHYPLAPRFEWVVLLCGWNDLAASPLINDSYGVKKNLLDSTTLMNATSEKGRRPSYHDLAVAQRLRETVQKIWHPAGTPQDTHGAWIDSWRQRRQVAMKTRAIQEVPHEELQAALRTYRKDLEQIIGTCRGQNQRLIMLTQPTIYRKDLPEELERLTFLVKGSESCACYTSNVLEQLMDAFNRTMIDVCRQRRIDCIDLAGSIPKDTTALYDDLHFNTNGCEKAADIVCDYFVAKLKTAE
jgi:hypothetical protein